jgi:hypothetical protein
VRSSNKDGSQDEGECGLRTSFKLDHLNRWSAPSHTEEVGERGLITTVGVSDRHPATGDDCRSLPTTGS